ncbi:helix-turn-helix transcriptional regulator [Haliea sp. E17]|uniref:helix-turn-helix transcriptional regulator n=1 Tax=Haliea sp. E17 TaxID=3401576 RepID=UPI003AAA9B7B
MSASLERVILELYGSLIETPPWESFLKILEDYFECRSCALLLRTPNRGDAGLLVSETRGLTGSSLMIEAFHDSPFLHLPDQQTYILSRMMPAEEFRKKHKRHYEYNQRLGTIDILALNLTHQQSGMSFRFRILRSEGSEPFGDRELEAMEKLLPHLNIATGIYARLVQQQQQICISDETSTRLGLGMVVLRRDGQVVTLNPAAESILKSARDLYVQGGQLHCAHRKDSEKLAEGLRLLAGDCAADAEYSFRITASDGNSSWLLTLQRNEIPQEFRDDQSDTISVLIRNSRQRTTITPEQLEQLLDLTPAEALLAARLVQGDSLVEAAETLGRSRSTVRAQLAAIFAKTGVHKQHQLISHIMQVGSELWL